MANPEHVEIVKGGAEAIVEFRKSNPDQDLELEGADLTSVDLESARLMGANLARCNLAGVNLRHAKLYEADLTGADLEGANLQSIETSDTSFMNANLHGADLSFATLFELDFESANLSWADLSFAQLRSVVVPHVNFEQALFYGTSLADIDFTNARSLEEVRHEGPSLIDERTLRKSWPLPDVFLRGVGLSDELIDFARATYGKAIEFYSCFISYSSEDDEFARRLNSDLQAEGVRCWFAPEDLKIGDELRPRIDEAIRLHDKLLLILSEESVQSEWVEDEVERALEKEQKAIDAGAERTVLFPISLDSAAEDTDAAWARRIRRKRHIGDFRAWKDHDAYQAAFARLLRDLKAGAKE